MKIKYIHIKNFKSFEDEEIFLDDLNILLGANASGKSNTVAIFRFISNIMLYGIEDAISLLGGINYTVNAKLGKKENIYLKFIIDISDEQKLSHMLRKENTVVRGKEIVIEFQIIPHKRGMGYSIGRDSIEIKYEIYPEDNQGETYNDLNNENEYKVTYERNGGKIKHSILNNTIYDDDILDSWMSGRFFIDFLNSKYAKKELLLNHLEFIVRFSYFGSTFIRIYDFDPKLMKTSSSITSKRRLEEDGSNIANILQRIIRNANEKSKLIALLQDSLPFVSKIDIQNNVDKSISYKITESYNNKSFYSNFLSDGTVNILALIIALYFEDDAGVIIIEEPERNLHPQLMSKIIEMAKERANNKQIIFTTHNPEIVRYAEVDNILYARRTEDGYTTIHKPINSEVIRRFIEADLGMNDLFVDGMLEE